MDWYRILYIAGFLAWACGCVFWLLLMVEGWRKKRADRIVGEELAKFIRENQNAVTVCVNDTKNPQEAAEDDAD